MEKELKEYMVLACKEGDLFEWVADNEWRIPKEDVIEILLCALSHVNPSENDALARELADCVDAYR